MSDTILWVINLAKHEAEVLAEGRATALRQSALPTPMPRHADPGGLIYAL